MTLLDHVLKVVRRKYPMVQPDVILLALNTYAERLIMANFEEQFPPDDDCEWAVAPI